MQPLEGIKVLDFSTLLPGPLATLFLAEAGASVVKIERPGIGDRSRLHEPKIEGESVPFALVNRGKKSIVADLKSVEDAAAVRRLAREADIVVEQFRPGVMARLGFGYEELSRDNPGLIYCSITGYGQTGPLADVAGHDLNYVARSGMLATTAGQDGAPTLPPALIGDIGGGTYPALVNILLALQLRAKTGRGSYIDIAMTESLFAWMSRSLPSAYKDRQSPVPGRGRHTGGSPRYGVYRTADDRFLAIAPLEPQFWTRFCELIGLAGNERDDMAEPEAVARRIGTSLASKSSAEWLAIFAGEDVCVELVQDVVQAMDDPHFTARGVFSRMVPLRSGGSIPALPVPIATAFQRKADNSYPALGETVLTADDIWE